MKCTKCGKHEAEWDFKEAQWCQNCFEDYCNDQFWKAVDEGRVV